MVTRREKEMVLVTGIVAVVMTSLYPERNVGKSA
jgi:hypothetical protein